MNFKKRYLSTQHTGGTDLTSQKSRWCHKWPNINIWRVRESFLVVRPCQTAHPVPVQTWQAGHTAGHRPRERPTAGACESLFQSCPSEPSRHGHVTPSWRAPSSCIVYSRQRRGVPSPCAPVLHRACSDRVHRRRPRADRQVAGRVERWHSEAAACQMMRPDCAEEHTTSDGTQSSMYCIGRQDAATQNSVDRSAHHNTIQHGLWRTCWILFSVKLSKSFTWSIKSWHKLEFPVTV